MKNLSILNDEQLQKISSLLHKKFTQEERERKYAPVKEILSLLGKGVLLSMVLLAPGTARAIRSTLYQENKDWEAWKYFNSAYLRRTIKRLQKQKIVTIEEKDGQQIVQITKKGERKILKYALSELELSHKKWDGKWRIVIYDIPLKYKHLREIIRETLKRLGFWQLQKSVYLTPFPCEEEIEFLREYYGLGENIKILTVGKLENEEVYRDYFGI